MGLFEDEEGFIFHEALLVLKELSPNISKN